MWYNYPNSWPYTDLHRLNLDWVLETVTDSNRKADGAVATANNAVSTANNAVSTANNAVGTATQAVNTANTAKATADAAAHTSASAMGIAQQAQKDAALAGFRLIKPTDTNVIDKINTYSADGYGVVLAPGTYYLPATATITSRAILFGHGAALQSSGQLALPANTLLYGPSVQVAELLINGAHVQLTDCPIVGCNIQVNASNFFMDSCYMSNNSIISTFNTDVNRIEISGCDLSSCQLLFAAGVQDLTIANCRLFNTPIEFITSGKTYSDIEIVGCRAEGGSYFLVLHEGALVTNFKLISNFMLCSSNVLASAATVTSSHAMFNYTHPALPTISGLDVQYNATT